MDVCRFSADPKLSEAGGTHEARLPRGNGAPHGDQNEGRQALRRLFGEDVDVTCGGQALRQGADRQERAGDLSPGKSLDLALGARVAYGATALSARLPRGGSLRRF